MEQIRASEIEPLRDQLDSVHGRLTEAERRIDRVVSEYAKSTDDAVAVVLKVLLP